MHSGDIYEEVPNLIKSLDIVKYRKLENLKLSMSPYINIISGTNGTCKSSLLHIISNAHQAVTKNCTWLRDKECLDIIKQINGMTNPKIESLTKGDKAYNDPANGVAGTLFTVDFFNHNPLEFRKHNSKISNRYAVKYSNEDAIKIIKKGLPEKYQEEIAQIYHRLVGINISSICSQKMGDIKTRADFDSDKTGIDSNTISAGEDNLFIIISAIVSLKYYFENIDSSNDVESILLIDEFDATLHPSLQFKLLDILREYSHAYKIQIFFTTHSLSALEYALKKKDNVIYLIDNITSVVEMDSPDIYKIKMFLYNVTKDDIYLSKKIPIFTEDNEARFFLNILFDYFEETYLEFSQIRRFFHFVDANIGANSLQAIFNDSYLLKTTMKYICILDGDQNGDLNKYTITLPGGDSPEKVIMSYALFLYDNDSPFWTADTILELNYGKVYFRDNIKNDIEQIDLTLKELRKENKSTHGVERELRKKIFVKHQRFFELLFKHWLYDEEHSESIAKFYKQLNIMFKKVSEFYGIDSRLWTVK